MKTLISNLKSLEASLLREVGELQVVLAQKVAEAQEIRRQIELQNRPILNAAETPSKPTAENAGSDSSPASLPSLIEKLLRENKDGLSLAELVQKISGAFVSQSKRPRSMVDQAIFRLKKQDRIFRNSDNLKFFLKEEQ